MPDLSQSLQGRDLGHLRIVAELWGVEFSAPDTRVGLQRLVPTLLNPDLVQDLLTSLPAGARTALNDLLVNEGRLPWPLFTRRYGAVREMGPGKRDRDRPYAAPTSPAEVLWYRALVARSFFDTPTGPEEFAFIPEDLLTFLPPPEGQPSAPLGRPATNAEKANLILANDRVLDHACTLLAALRLGKQFPPTGGLPWPSHPPSGPYSLSPALLRALLGAAGLLDPQGLPQPEPARAFLEATRAHALAQLARAWQHSSVLDELRLIPHLQTEGEWVNDPLRTRRTVLDFLSTIPEDKWWSFTAFVTAIRQSHPDFQRPAGDYDSWYIRRRGGAEDDFLRGFENWDAVDGEVVRFTLAGYMHWLGMVDLAVLDASPFQLTAFRLSRWASALLKGEPPSGLPVEDEPLYAGSDARVRAPRLAPRAARYQVARFCDWEEETEDAYRYRLTPSSLARARQQGLTTTHLLTLLRKYTQSIPPTLVKAIERWETSGPEARLEQVTVLRLSTPDLLQTLRSSRASRFLGDPLGPAAVVIKPGASEKVLAILAEMGYLGEIKLEK